MKTLILMMSLVLTGCGSTLKVGVGTEFNGSTIQDQVPACGAAATNCQRVAERSPNGVVGLVSLETPSWRDLSLQYTHVSRLNASDENPLDMVTVNYTFTLGGD